MGFATGVPQTMANIIPAIILIGLCFLGFGVGVLFFGKPAEKTPCGSVPEAYSHDDCPSKKMGICPTLDDTGLISKITRPF